MNNQKSLLALALLLIFFSCDRIKGKRDAVVNKTKEAASKTREKLRQEKNNLAEKVFPIYDHGKSDTESNKKRFREYLQVAPTPDVKEVYSYGDFMGIDYKVLIAFKCDTATINNIVKVKKMSLSNEEYDHGLTFGEEFPWWDKNAIEQIQPYKVGKEYEYWEYLWYDPKTNLAYYQQFSL